MSNKLSDCVQEMLECCICADEFSDPRVLPCIHTYCLRCLERIGQDKRPGENMPCPLCRREFKIPVTGLKGMQKNFFIAKLLEIRGGGSAKDSRTGRECDACLEGHEEECDASLKGHEVPPAALFCAECDQKLCEECVKSHRRSKASKLHKLTDLKFTQMSQKSKDASCVLHARKPIEMYCYDCGMAICMICYAEGHQGHKCKAIQPVGEEFRMELDVVIKKLALRLSSIKLEENKIKERSQMVVKTFDTLKADVLKQAANIKNKIDQHVSKLLAEIDSKKTEKLNDIQKRKEELNSRVSFLESSERFTAQIKEKGSAVDICKSFKVINTMSEAQDNHGRPGVTADIEDNGSFSFRPSKFEDLLIDTEMVIGKLEFGERRRLARVYTIL